MLVVGVIFQRFGLWFSLLLLRFQFAPPCSKSVFKMQLLELVYFPAPPPSALHLSRSVSLSLRKARERGKEGMNIAVLRAVIIAFCAEQWTQCDFLEGFINKFWSHRGNMFLPSRHICILINVNGSCKHWTENRPGSVKDTKLLPTGESHSAQDLAVGTLAVFC